VTNDLGKSLLVKVGPRLLGVLHISKHSSDVRRAYSVVVSSGASFVGGICGPEQRCLTEQLVNISSCRGETDETSHPTGTAYRE